MLKICIFGYLSMQNNQSSGYFATGKTNRIYHHFVQGQGNPPECQRFAVHDEACRVVEVAYLWHEGGFPCPCTKLWLIIFLLSPLIVVRNPLFYLRNYYRTFSDHKTAPTGHRVIVNVMTSLYDHHFRFVHNGVAGDNPLETSFWILIKRMDISVWGRRKVNSKRGSPLKTTPLMLTLVIFRYNDLFEKSVQNINNLFFCGGIEVIPIYKQYNPRSIFYGVFGVVLRFVLEQTKLLDAEFKYLILFFNLSKTSFAKLKQNHSSPNLCDRYEREILFHRLPLNIRPFHLRGIKIM